ncbi:MAG: hypothetical protein ACJ74U_10100 [Jatrophihabitantaceae bacterium]
MQVWLVAGAWLFALLLAAVLLGFAGYELAWKTRRLKADRAKLDQTVAELAQLSGQLQAVADRAAGLRSPETAGLRSPETAGIRSPGAAGSSSTGLVGSSVEPAAESERRSE